MVGAALLACAICAWTTPPGGIMPGGILALITPPAIGIFAGWTPPAGIMPGSIPPGAPGRFGPAGIPGAKGMPGGDNIGPRGIMALGTMAPGGMLPATMAGLVICTELMGML